MRWLRRAWCYLTGHNLLWETWHAIDMDAQCYALGCSDCRRYWEPITFTETLLQSTPRMLVDAYRYGVLTACEVDAQKRWWKP